ncbi:DUF6686 family protein [Taibaiella koreensis]|uniref:DUF6686 family protein n=1 Tax=Taibaiella koreensis TaxID=1268548 RepID=UPI000E59F681|nr:DUF6686 family protein [Taibaiella koreensis]
MCNTQTLARSADGYIIRCTECNRIQLAFGIAAVTLKPHQFQRLKEYADMEQEYRTAVFAGPDQKCVSLPVNHTLTLCLTLAELQALTDLLDQAAGLITVYELLT